MRRTSVAVIAVLTTHLLLSAPQKSTGKWASVGNSPAARSGACAALLADGRILIAGGGGPVSSAEVHIFGASGGIDPSAMISARTGHACTTLGDGRILVTGGFNQSGHLNTAEIYDPANNQWLPAPNMVHSRSGHTATLLPDGRVLVAGGEDAGEVHNTLEILDPAASSFSLLSTASLSSARKYHAAAPLPDGRILIVGGSNGSAALASADIFEPATGVIAAAGFLSVPRAGLSATVMADGSVLIAGGTNGIEDLSSAEIFDPLTGNFVETARMTAARRGHLAVPLPPGNEVLLLGGDASGSGLELFSLTREAGSGSASPSNGAGVPAARRAAADATEGAIRLAPRTGAASLDQCANGPGLTGGNIGQTCLDWVNGNLNSSKAAFREGDSIPYRLRMSGITPGSNTVTIEWDTTQQGKHALDYLATYNRSVTGADPCAGVSGCILVVQSPDIPPDPNITPGGIQPQQMLPGRMQEFLQKFYMWGGTITGMSLYTRTGDYIGNSATSITITFDATVPNPVLAWSGHIATRVDWGALYSAVAISGSPFHMRLSEVNGSGGNQDRSLSNDAAIFPGTIEIIKQANVGGTPFSFTASPAPLGAFSLTPSSGSPPQAKQTFANIFTFTSYQVAETVPVGWTLATPSCTKIGSGSFTTNATGVSIDLKEGDEFTCTFVNTINANQVTLTKACVPASDGGSFSLAVNGTTVENQACGGSVTKLDVAFGTSVTASETAGAGTDLANYTSSISCMANGSSIGTAAGDGRSITFTMSNAAVACTVTNTRKTRQVTLAKVCSPTGDNGKFNLTVSSTGVTTPTETEKTCGTSTAAKTVFVGESVTASEAAGTNTSLANYDSSMSCSANGNPTPIATGTTSASFTMPDASVSCTVTNTRKTRQVTLAKVCVPDSDGGVFNLTINGTTENGKTCGQSMTKNDTAVGESITVSETEGTNTLLSNYTISLTCTSNGSTIASAATSSTSFTMPDASVSCTVTNTRKKYTVTLTKVLNPPTDGGLFNLVIKSNGAVLNSASGVGNNGQVQFDVAGGTPSVTVEEAAANGTNLAQYVTTWNCNVSAFTGTTTYSRTFTMPDQAVTCTVTNSRPSISVSKSCTANMSASFAVSVSSTGTVCNQGPVALQNVQVTDAQTIGGGTGVTATVQALSTTSLEACPTPGSCNKTNNPTSCVDFTSTYTPTQPSSGTNACTFNFSDLVSVTAASVDQGVQVSGQAQAGCPLCGACAGN
ncbi:MAG: hypothetical protein HYS04_17910 [Acidobacteria bacterium]|nr:hypothetical protein [Acidobacteriota bacterium]